MTFPGLPEGVQPVAFRAAGKGDLYAWGDSIFSGDCTPTLEPVLIVRLEAGYARLFNPAENEFIVTKGYQEPQRVRAIFEFANADDEQKVCQHLKTVHCFVGLETECPLPACSPHQ